MPHPIFEHVQYHDQAGTDDEGRGDSQPHRRLGAGFVPPLVSAFKLARLALLKPPRARVVDLIVVAEGG